MQVHAKAQKMKHPIWAPVTPTHVSGAGCVAAAATKLLKTVSVSQSLDFRTA